MTDEGEDERMNPDQDQNEEESLRTLAVLFLVVGVGFISLMLLAAWLIF